MPAFTVTGKVIPLTEYPDPFQAAEETTTSPLLADKVPVNAELLPTATFPKFIVEGDTMSVPSPLLGGSDFELEDLPEQPTRIDEHMRASTALPIRNCNLHVLSTTTIVDLDSIAVERAKGHVRTHERDDTFEAGIQE